MDTIHISNHHYSWHSPILRKSAAIATLVGLAIVLFSPNWQLSLLVVILLTIALTFTYYTLVKSRVTFTLTATHIQQHMFKGGWALRWSDIERIGTCSHHQNGWHTPLPWIGLRINNYQAYLNAICPRIATDLLLSQRALLYLGMQQTTPHATFEDIVLDSTAFIDADGSEYHGLMAMLANRMKYQREFFGYDIFISEADLDRNGEAFVGLTRRYLAAADRDMLKP
ncbi:DUF2982 domain-containing protein [Vibrio methylphosphonaticus]|uniref:DUF2982 domain-containing protein n=1 Tax=Vibrio methylphosphonaticus TaxID=2946866 RepID=UPI00202A672F|nr:DUF2982 domain-containing protein [Vibrio methylphosphonaticus]MCL9775850.1 DUF2982 domain-containing protein [Vibrio methylphosphonaticus]